MIVFAQHERLHGRLLIHAPRRLHLHGTLVVAHEKRALQDKLCFKHAVVLGIETLLSFVNFRFDEDFSLFLRA